MAGGSQVVQSVRASYSESQRILDCPQSPSGKYRWWKGSGCPLESYQEIKRCSDDQGCDVAADYGSGSFDFCCSLGADSAPSDAVKCYSITSKFPISYGRSVQPAILGRTYFVGVAAACNAERTTQTEILSLRCPDPCAVQ